MEGRGCQGRRDGGGNGGRVSKKACERWMGGVLNQLEKVGTKNFRAQRTLQERALGGRDLVGTEKKVVKGGRGVADRGGVAKSGRGDRLRERGRRL